MALCTKETGVSLNLKRKIMLRFYIVVIKLEPKKQTQGMRQTFLHSNDLADSSKRFNISLQVMFLLVRETRIRIEENGNANTACLVAVSSISFPRTHGAFFIA